MSVIQTIRDKAAWIIIGAIALALIAFIVQDALQGGSRGLFSGNSTTLGKVNGTKIDAREYEQRYKLAEDNYRNQNYPVNDQLRYQIRESLWNEYVEDAILSDEYKELGITVSDKELSDILYGANPPQQLRQQFTDSTGMYNAQAAYQAIRSIKKNSPQYNSFWGEFIPALEKSRQREKFTSLVGKSVYVPKWLVEKNNAESSQRSSISFVNVPYSSISDSTVKVSDDEIKEYVNAHKEMYKQEEGASIIYTIFDAAPTKEDSLAVFNQVAQQKDALAAATDVQAVQTILANSGTETQFFNGYVLSSKMQMTNADTIRNLPNGAVFGPYLDGGNYTLAKMIDRRQMPDSVKVRHILIKTADQQAGQVRTDSAAHKLIDSIANAIKAGANFDSMVVKFSDDPGSKDKGGEYEFSSLQFSNISKEFAEVAFYGQTGDKKVVKVEGGYSGYHYIEVLNQKKIETAYKIAYLARPIIASNETINRASGLAAQFAGESRSLKEFDENANKKKLNKFPAEIKPVDFMIMGLGEARELIRWVFNDAKKGMVADHPFLIGDKYVVAGVNNMYEKGPMPVEKARPLVEYKIRNDKKAEQLTKKIGNANSLEAIAQANKQTVMHADSIMFNSSFIPNVGNELKVLGASFNKEFQTKVSPPIKGEMGVFVIKVDNIVAVPNPNFDAKQMQNTMQQQLAGMAGYRTIEIMKKSANIKDYRVKFF
jgi:peptidyl-prolyl cis-trans isomerase D